MFGDHGVKDVGMRCPTLLIYIKNLSLKVGRLNFIKAHGMSWPHLVDSDGRSKGLFGPGVPVTWFIDEGGEVVGKKIGAYLNKEQLFSQVENAFGVKL
jgi:hypothetical protein